MIDLRSLRPLLTSVPAEEGRPSFVSAASGAVFHQGTLHVVADDEQSLASFPRDGSPGTWTPLLPGELPLDPKLRKAVKADLETLTSLPPSEASPHGALFALGSGSHPRRRWGALLAFDPAGQPAGPATRVDLQPLYDVLRRRLGELNIEGAAVLPDRLVLLQRGTPTRADNVLVWLDLSKALSALAAGRPWGEELLANLCTVRLPPLGNAALAFTDGLALGGDRLLFTAAAEERGNAYDDGPCAGSAIGVVTTDGRLVGLEPVTPRVKLEGVAIVEDRLWLVTDDDQPDRPAQLFEAPLPGFAR